ncbi:MAG: fasciclin domain-containing protein [Streptosporangiaceae bacterium]
MSAVAPVSRRRSRGRLASSAGLIAAGLLTLAACGTAPKPTATPTGSPGPSTPPATQAPAATTGTIGARCGMFPSADMAKMRGEDALRAVEANPQLSAFVTAVRAAALDTALQGQHSFTLFVPSNTAFGSMSSTDLSRLHNPSELIRTLKYHVVLGQVAPGQFASGTSATTVEGGKLALAKSGSTYTVNKATVLCGNIRTSDATIYVINQVLWPPK